MKEGITWVGMDTHKKFHNIAVLLPGESGFQEWRVENTDRDIRRLVRKLLKMAPGEIRCCYLAEIYEIRRFQTARELMSFLGLTPSEHSTGDPSDKGKGPITKCGNKRVRRVLIEAVWHYRHRPTVSAALRKRRNGQPERTIGIANKARQRLNRRYHRLVA